MRAAGDVATRVVRVALLDVTTVHHAASEHALADLARALQNVPGREEQAQAQCNEAKAIAERLSATALRVAAENMTVRV